VKFQKSDRNTGAMRSGLATNLWLLSLMLLAGLPSAWAQGCTSQGVTGSISASLNVTPCVQVTAPQGRKFVIFTLSETYEHWQNGNGCQSNLLGDCGNALSLQVSINPIGFSYTLAGSVGTLPPGPGWTDTVGNSLCVDPACVPCQADELAEINACHMDQACIQKALDKYAACTAGLAHDSPIVSTRQSTKIFRLPSGLTDNGPATLTMSTTSMGNQPLLGGLLLMSAGLYSDTRFTMNQTSSTFRPRDARDTAANCIAADQNGQTHDGDCHPRYTVQFVCGTSLPSHAENSLTPPLLLASAGAWRLRGLSARPRAVLGPKPIALFIGAPPPPCPNPPVLYQFQLDKQTEWLRGTSTNFGSDTAGDPDYVFEQGNVPGYNVALNTDLSPPQDGGLRISTPDFVTMPQNVTVSSRDFGGAARLRAIATLKDGQTFDADVVDPNGNTVRVPGGACGSVFAVHQFASIPVDQDCNGIADSWEDANSTQNGAHLPPDWDKEPGVGANSPTGDGYSVHDEYRGFHFVTDSWSDDDTPDVQQSKMRWSATDPLTKQDVFFWDSAGPTSCAVPGLPVSCSTPALRLILDAQTAQLGGPANFMAYRRVNFAQAHSRSDIGFALSGVRQLNKNSKYPLHRGFAVVYADDTLGADCLATPPRGGEVGNSGGFSNDGTPIRIDYAQIGICGAVYRFPTNVYLARTLAHESGHKFGLAHPERARPTRIFPLEDRPLFAQVQNLNFVQYMIDPVRADLMYLRYNIYAWSNQIFRSDNVLFLRNRANAIAYVPPPGSPPGTQPTPPSAVYQIQAAAPIATCNGCFVIENQPDFARNAGRIQDLMGWSVKWTVQQPNGWGFSDDSLSKINVKP
jgi:hypothetical protein